MSTPIVPTPPSYQNLSTVTGGIPALRPQQNGAAEGGTIRSEWINGELLQHGRAYLTSADLLAGNTTKASLISAPGFTINEISTPLGNTSPGAVFFGATKTPTLIAERAVMWYQNGANYTDGGNMTICYHNTTTTTLATYLASQITGGANSNTTLGPLNTAVDLTAVAGLGLDLNVAVNNFGNGTGNLAVDIWYKYV